MKGSKLALTFLLFLCHLFCKAQYIPLPYNNSYWRVDYFNSHICTAYPIPSTEYNMYFDGDTIINAVSYKNLYGSGITNCLQLGFLAAIRQDSIERKAYIFNYNNSTDELLYDFNLNVGDTVGGYLDDTRSVIVLQRDSVYMEGAFRTRLHLSGSSLFDNYIIEGVGSTLGLIFPVNQMDYASTLVCFSHNGNAVYPDSIHSCNLVDNTSLPINLKNQVNVYPNPICQSEKLHIGIPVEAILFYNSLGELMLEKREQLNDISVSKLDWNCKHFVKYLFP